MLGEVAVLALIVFRRVYKPFPVFSSYLLFQLIAVGMFYSFPTFSGFLALSFINSAFILAVLGELSRTDWFEFIVLYPEVISGRRGEDQEKIRVRGDTPRIE